MRKLITALAALMFVGTFAFAQANTGACDASYDGYGERQSETVGWNQSELDVCVEGDVVDALDFEVASAKIALATNQVRPGNSFTVEFKVTNNSSRDIFISDGSNLGPVSSIITFNNEGSRIAMGTNAYVSYTFTFPPADDDNDWGNWAQTNFGVGYGDTAHVVLTMVGNGDL